MSDCLMSFLSRFGFSSSAAYLFYKSQPLSLHTQPHPASINIEQVSRNLDISSLQKNLTNIAFCDIEAEDLRDVDQHVVKLFKLAQLMLEYVRLLCL